MTLNNRPWLVMVIAAISSAFTWAGELPQLRVSDNRHFLQQADGQPFFWLADTAWELFHRTDKQDAIKYLEHRAQHGFNVIQAVALAELDGLGTPNKLGFKPLIDNDPTRPDIKAGPDNDYWDHVDYVIAQANQRGLYVGLLPTWGDKWNKKWGQGPEIFSPENAEQYGKWLGQRYQNAGIIWILGGDRPIENDQHKEITRAMARGLRRGDRGSHLITWHPSGGTGSSQYFQNEEWLDFHMRQNGHTAEFGGTYESTWRDYQLQPTKPVIDGEPIYEDHPISFDAAKFGHSVAADIRRTFYWDVFSGACGHTYGHHSVWQMWSEDKEPINNPLMVWTAAIDQPGALQMKHGRALMESRPFFTRIPAPQVIVTDRVATSIPGAGRYRFVATGDTDGTYLMVYCPVSRAVTVNTSFIKHSQLSGWWFDPRTGQAAALGTFENSGQHSFTPPSPGELLDWILVIDDASRQYAPPGKK